MRGQQRRIHALSNTKSRQAASSTRLLKPKLPYAGGDTLRPVSDDQPSSLSARLISYLMPDLRPVYHCRFDRQKNHFTGPHPCPVAGWSGILWAAGWVRLDWDGRGAPGGLRWIQAAPSDANWAYSDRKPNENDPAFWPAIAVPNAMGCTPAGRPHGLGQCPAQANLETVVGGGHPVSPSPRAGSSR